MRLLLDMNISPSWVSEFSQSGFETLHWSFVGDPKASDVAILAWAADNGYVVVTYDLDFGELIALTRSSAPSVVQIRGTDLLAGLEHIVIAAIRQFERELDSGALLSVSTDRTRVRLLPFDPI
ncbi:MAG: DUF5615 family PIN-like protein [Cyanobacteria bacterium]|nr:DUF5615 family PIN-like protein [Cyanobacteriota bacterium]